MTKTPPLKEDEYGWLDEILVAYSKQTVRLATGKIEGGTHLSHNQAKAAIQQHIQEQVLAARIDELDKLLAPLDSVFTQHVDELTIVKRMAKLKALSLSTKDQGEERQ